MPAGNRFNKTLDRSSRGMPSQRQLRVGEEIRHILAQIMLREDLHDEIIMQNPVTVSEVQMSPDLKTGRAFVISSKREELEEIVKRLNGYAAFFRQELAKHLTIKFMPRLIFKPDLSFDAAERIHNLLRSPRVAQDLLPAEESEAPDDE